MPPVVPTWFKYRQGKLEEAGPDLFRLHGPNLVEGIIGVHQQKDGKFAAFLRDKADGDDLVRTDPVIPTAYEAWEAAFELFRGRKVI